MSGKGLTEEQKNNLKKQLGLGVAGMTLDVGLRHHRQAPKVVIPMRLMELMNFVYHTQTSMGNEYGLFLNCDFDEKTFTYKVNLEREIMIPKQKVTPGHIDFLEIPEKERFNTVIHRHPAGVRGFSGTDDEFINKDFEVSILFLPPMDFPTAIVNIPLKGSTTNFVQLKAEIVFAYSIEGITGLGELNDNDKCRAHVKENIQPLATVAPINYATGNKGNGMIPSYQTPVGGPSNGVNHNPINRFQRGPLGQVGAVPKEINIPLSNFVDQTATYLYNLETLKAEDGTTVENEIGELFTYADLVASMTDYLIDNHIVENDMLYINTTEYKGVNLSNVHTVFRETIVYEYLEDLERMMAEEDAQAAGLDGHEVPTGQSFLDGLGFADDDVMQLEQLEERAPSAFNLSR